MKTVLEAIYRHRKAWRAFQDAPDGEVGAPEWEVALEAEDAETEALVDLMGAIPSCRADLISMRAYLDWWVVEEAQRREIEPAPFALHAYLALATEAERERCARIADASGHPSGPRASADIAAVIRKGGQL